MFKHHLKGFLWFLACLLLPSVSMAQGGNPTLGDTNRLSVLISGRIGLVTNNATAGQIPTMSGSPLRPLWVTPPYGTGNASTNKIGTQSWVFGQTNIYAGPVTTGPFTASSLKYPTSDGSSNAFMRTDGAGNLVLQTVTIGTGNASTNANNFWLAANTNTFNGGLLTSNIVVRGSAMFGTLGNPVTINAHIISLDGDANNYIGNDRIWTHSSGAQFGDTAGDTYLINQGTTRRFLFFNGAGVNCFGATTNKTWIFSTNSFYSSFIKPATFGADGGIAVGGSIGAGGKIFLSRETFSDAAFVVTGNAVVVAQIGTMSASRALTLPPASAYGSGFLTIADESGTVTGVNTIVVTRAGADTINGGTTSTIITAYGTRVLLCDGVSKWTVTSSL